MDDMGAMDAHEAQRIEAFLELAWWTLQHVLDGTDVCADVVADRFIQVISVSFSGTMLRPARPKRPLIGSARDPSLRRAAERRSARLADCGANTLECRAQAFLAEWLD